MFDFKNIVKKYNYTEEFSALLNKIYYSLINYYGNEKIIYNAFLNTEIKNVDDIYGYLFNNNLLDESGLVSIGDIKRSSGIYVSEPIIDKNNDKYTIKEVKRVVLVKDFDINNVNKQAILIHELCHMVKSFENEYIVDKDILLNSSGLIKRKYKLKYEAIVKKELIEEKAVGLEEGFTTLSEECIVRDIIDKSYNQSGYGPVYILAKKLLDVISEDIVIDAQMHHDKNILSEYISNYENLEDLSDIIYKLNLQMYKKAFDPEILDDIKNKIIKIIKEKYIPILENNKKKGRRK